MRTLCDVCEQAAAILFCAADEAALCRACDEKVHMCNKLANRHVRVGLAEPSEVPRCDICENASAFFYCEVDGSSLCLQCDMIVHVGCKRTHGRYLLLRQKVEFLGDKPGHTDELALMPADVGGPRKETKGPLMLTEKDCGNSKIENIAIDLNARPQKTFGQGSNNREQGCHHDSPIATPVVTFNMDPEK